MSMALRSRNAPPPDLSLERALRSRAMGPVAGIDEAGRGPIAGPVVAAAVILDEGAIPAGIRDSKELTPDRRVALYDEIVGSAAVGVAMAGVDMIDRDNILEATLWAMARACEHLPRRPAAVLVDGNRLPDLACPAESVVGGDRRSLSIAAASIIAKVTRDRLMDGLARRYPVYGFERHRGYPTRAHLDALARHGPCPHHRLSFAPVAACLAGASPVPATVR
jgi:ribonuclease HII